MTEKMIGIWVDEEMWSDLKILSARERRPIKVIGKELFADYLKEHGDGNPNFTLDQFDHEQMKAVPAVFRDLPFWQKYINGMNEKDFREMESQVYAIKDKLDKKWERGFD